MQILNRGLNPTICEDASFQLSVVTPEPPVTQTTTDAPVLSFIPEPATSTLPTLPGTRLNELV